MSTYTPVIKKHRAVHIESLREDMARRKDPHFFWPTGTQVYVGQQGSGKTISAVKHLLDLKARYPRAILVSNLNLNYFKPIDYDNEKQLLEYVELIKQDDRRANYYFRFKNMNQLALALTMVNNDFEGVIYIIDEIHTYFNALDSKNIPMYVFTEISQQRKQRKCIIGTSQLFLRMAKPLREQCDNIIVCTTKFGIFTRQTAYDGMTLEQDYSGKLIGNVRKRGYFFHNSKIRNAFDTYQKVVSGSEQYETITKIEIQQKNKKLGIKK